jgi:hypothetical protein
MNPCMWNVCFRLQKKEKKVRVKTFFFAAWEQKKEIWEQKKPDNFDILRTPQRLKLVACSAPEASAGRGGCHALNLLHHRWTRRISRKLIRLRIARKKGHWTNIMEVPFAIDHTLKENWRPALSIYVSLPIVVCRDGNRNVGSVDSPNNLRKLMSALKWGHDCISLIRVCNLREAVSVAGQA